jgi:hypothetical protein
MAASIQVKRGATAKVAAYTPLSGEMVLDTTTNKLYAGDGVTAGGNQIVASKKGVTDGSSAAVGEEGEYLSATATSVAMATNATAYNITSLTITPGEWDVTGVLQILGTANLGQVAGSLSSSSGMAGFPYTTRIQGVAAPGPYDMPMPTTRFNVASNTVLYLVALATFTSGSASASGLIRARRIR